MHCAQVHFLYEEEIVDALSQAIEKKLKGSNESRAFSVQPITSMLGISSLSSSASASDSRSLVDSAASGRSRTANDGTDDNDGDASRVITKRLRARDDDVDDDFSDDDPDDSDGKVSRLLVPTSQVIEVSLSQKAVPASKKYNPLNVRPGAGDRESVAMGECLTLERVLSV